MLLGTKEELLAFFANPNQRNGLVQYAVGRHDNPEAALNAVRTYLLRGGGLGKGLRPWDVIHPRERLDVNQAWVGFEFETGYNTQAELLAAIKWFDKNIERGVYDYEGSGPCPLELTFYPVALADLDKAGPEKLIRHAERAAPAWHVPERRIGTHLNISTPHFRAGGQIKSRILREALQQMTPLYHKMLLGRDNPAMPEMLYVHPGVRYEFKIFNTTYDIKQWERYKIVTRGIVAIIQWMEQNIQRPDAEQRAYIDAQLGELFVKVQAVKPARVSAARAAKLADREAKAKAEKVWAVANYRRIMDVRLPEAA